MVRSLILGAVLTIGLMTVANAGFAPNAIGDPSNSLHALRKVAVQDGGADRAAAVIRWREGVFAREDTTLARKAGGAGRIEIYELMD
jgi:hypothetical protein